MCLERDAPVAAVGMRSTILRTLALMILTVIYTKLIFTIKGGRI